MPVCIDDCQSIPGEAAALQQKHVPPAAVQPPQASGPPTNRNPQAWCSRTLAWFWGKMPVCTVQIPPRSAEATTADRRPVVGSHGLELHLKPLAQVRFVTVEHAGTSSRYQGQPLLSGSLPHRRRRRHGTDTSL